MEARVGPLLNLVDGAASPAAVLSFRMTVSRRVSFGAPLFVSVIAVDAGPVWLSFSGGITNLFTGSAPFFVPVWTLHAEGYALGSTTAARVRAGVTGRIPGSTWAGVQLAVLQRLGERVSIGVELEARWQLEPMRSPSVALSAGAWTWPKMGPTVRVWLTGAWSVDLIALVGTGQPALIAGAALVWAPKILP